MQPETQLCSCASHVATWNCIGQVLRVQNTPLPALRAPDGAVTLQMVYPEPQRFLSYGARIDKWVYFDTRSQKM